MYQKENNSAVLKVSFRPGLHCPANVRMHETPAYKRSCASILPLVKFIKFIVNHYLVSMPFRKSHIVSLLTLLFSVSLKAQTVYKTPSGAKYHLATCHMVKNVSEEITIAKANELGLEPCKICKPSVSLAQTPQKTAQGQNTTVQCKGFTKAGSRCKHMTAIANGYCYQHQP